MRLDEVPIAEVWTLLGGRKLRDGNARGTAFWRPKADGWNVAVDRRKNCWFDHRGGVGGGVLKLVQTVKGCTAHDALTWLEAYAGLTPSRPPSPEELRRDAQAREHAPALARAATLWHAERLIELDELKRRALERLGWQPPFSEEEQTQTFEERFAAVVEFEAVASEHHLLSILAPEGIIRAYSDARRKWPEHTRALVADGERWAEFSETAVALLIGQWHEDAVEFDRSEMDGGAAA
jgi:hypothetical protein